MSEKKQIMSRWMMISTIMIMVLAYTVHRPLPQGFTKSPLDRIAMHIIEPVLRLSYYYPSRLFPDAGGMVWWTRLVLNNLAAVIGPLWNSDPALNMNTTTFDGITVRVYEPRYNGTSDGAVIFIHGGGFALGNIQMYESLTRRMAKMLNTVLVSIEYRLSPETPFPGGLDDCERAIEYFMANAYKMYGVDTSKVVIMGDSAGGNLAAAITQRRHLAKKTPEILAQVLMYPLLQMADMQSTSYRYFHKNLNGLALVDPESVAYYYMWYAGIDMIQKPHLVKHALVNGHIAPELQHKINKVLSYSSFSHLDYGNASLPDRENVIPSEEARQLMAPFLMNPDFAPIMREDLSGLPRAFVMTCEYDVLRDEGIMYAKRLQDAGVPTTAVNYVNGFHAMLNFHNEVEEAAQSLHDIVHWTRRTLLSADRR